MVLDTAYSVNDVPIHLTEERWDHITDRRPYMTSYYDETLDAVERPTWVLPGHRGGLIAVRNIGRFKYLHVVYREVSLEDGFIVTAYVARKVNKRRAIWREENQ
jgi:glyoxylase-like metal-dependent hydrolase (beta-lactamase superfamily II)